MGKCIYCGKSAGLFSPKHKECENKFAEGKFRITDIVYSNILEPKLQSGEEVKNSIDRVANESYIPEELKNQLIVEGFGKAVEKFLDDGVLSEQEEKALVNFMEVIPLGKELYNSNNAINKAVQGAILRGVLDGVIPENKVQVTGNLPFNFQKGEKVIWVYNNANYFETRTKTHYEGRSSGYSIRIAQGLYYRTGQFKGNPITTSELKFISDGMLALTDQNIYFHSSAKSVRYPYKKLLTIEPYSDGIGIHEDKATAKPKAFGNVDGWFVYNVVKFYSEKR